MSDEVEVRFVRRIRKENKGLKILIPQEVRKAFLLIAGEVVLESILRVFRAEEVEGDEC